MPSRFRLASHAFSVPSRVAFDGSTLLMRNTSSRRPAMASPTSSSERPLPYISAWHQAPITDDEDLSYLHLQLFSVRRSADKLKYLAGSESGMNAFITDVLPEDVAQRLREV